MRRKLHTNFLISTCVCALMSIMVFFPAVLNAQNNGTGATEGTGLVIKCQDGGSILKDANGNPVGDEKECGYYDLVRQVNRIVFYLFMFSIPLTAISFSYAGFIMLTAGGNSGAISRAKGIFYKVLTGFLFMLIAWVLVKLIADQLIKPGIINIL